MDAFIEKKRTEESYTAIDMFLSGAQKVLKRVYETMTAGITVHGIDRQREIKARIESIGVCSAGRQAGGIELSRWISGQLMKVAQERNDLP